MRGLYIHVPFCARRCSYCDFDTYVAPAGGFGALVRLELEQAASAWPGPVDGTPTLLAPAELAGILRAVDLAPGAEITVEANPDSVDARRGRQMRTGGYRWRQC